MKTVVTLLFLVASLAPAPVSAQRTAIRFTCTCGDSLTEQLASDITKQLATNSGYIEATSQTTPKWRLAIDSVVATSSSLAVSVAVTNNGHLVDQWAEYCTSAQLEACSFRLLNGALKDIEIDAKNDSASTVSKQSQPPESESRPQTGDPISPSLPPFGHGVLKLTCSADLESRVKVFNAATGMPVRDVYVRAGKEVQVSDIAPGSYWVKVEQGHYYNGKSKMFVSDTHYFKFPHPYAFSETDMGGHTEYTEVGLTLNATSDGNVEPLTISGAEFWQNDPAASHQKF